MGKFAESIGLLELDIAGQKFTFKPIAGDGLRFSRVINAVKQHKDESKLFEQINSLVLEMILRAGSKINTVLDKSTGLETYDKPSELSDEDKTELRVLIECNQVKLQQDMMIAFKWTTQEKLDKLENQLTQGDSIKKAINL